jgi:hypothetical protein
VPPGGCSITSHDVESSSVSASANDSTSLPSSESAPTTPQSSSSSVPADGTDPLARRMGKFPCLTVLLISMLHVFVVMYQDIVDCKQKHAQSLFYAQLFYCFLL